MSAEQGGAAAIDNLGRCYEEGIGVAIDLAQAVELYQDASKL